MSASKDYSDRFALNYVADKHRRIIAGKNVVLHCHHYNSLLQQSIENVAQVDGKKIFRDAAEFVFDNQIKNVFKSSDSQEEKFEIAKQLYAHLGYGMLDFSKVAEGVVTASSAHFVEGWNAAFGSRDEPVCTFTEGFIQGAIHAVTGETVTVREKSCLVSGHEKCKFEIDGSRADAFSSFSELDFNMEKVTSNEKDFSGNIDEQSIIDAVVSMPIWGDDEGLIPAFSVYLACTPDEFYNLACHTFVTEMEKQNLLSTAQNLLTYCGEVCGLKTFQGIMASEEWAGLVQPMIIEESDNIYALVAISNAFGWGNWHILEHVPYQSLKMESYNGYEAFGYRAHIGEAASPRCYMLTGVSAGMMELIYSTGTVDDRYGTYFPDEYSCICCKETSCTFEVELT